MIKLFAIVVAAASLLTNPSLAEVQKAPNNGNQMVKLCTAEKDAVAQATCQGFLFGVIETTRIYAAANQLQPMFCVPKETPQSQVVAAYVKFVEENHARKHFPAAMLAISALKEAFPCEQA